MALNPTRKRLLAFLNVGFILLLSIVQHKEAIAQLRLVPIAGYDAAIREIEQTGNLRTTAVTTFPFFDDFSTARKGQPDTSYWEKGSGVYVNNQLTTNHPSINVATFDGLNSNGEPYNFTNPLRQDFTDTLTSQPINLAGKAAKDSIYLSFYWLGGGLGERPDSVDHMQVEFRDASGNWEVVWTENGYKIDTTFRQQFIKVNDAKFFHSAFQFRFRTYGRSSGSYDMWHLDYVYLNEKRTAKDRYMVDLSTRAPLTSFLKGYKAVPMRHFKTAASKYLAPNITAEVVNHNTLFNKYSYKFTITDELTRKVYVSKDSSNVQIGETAIKKNVIEVKALGALANDTSKKLRLKYKFEMPTTDGQSRLGNMSRNDSITAITELSDYYAFDDGTAEYGIQISEKSGRAVIRYDMAQADTIAGVRISLARFDKDISGQTFSIQLYSAKDGKPDQILTQRTASARYSEERDGFMEVKFAQPIVVSESFFVGWTQIEEQPISVGYDKNSLGGSVFAMSQGIWREQTKLKGGIMIRPYLSSGATVEVTTGLEAAEQEARIFFPNPSGGEINWKSSQVKSIEVYNQQGVLVQQIKSIAGKNAVNLNVPSGIYLLKSSDGKYNVVQKIVVAK